MLSDFDNTINGWCLVKKQANSWGSELDLLLILWQFGELTVNLSAD